MHDEPNSSILNKDRIGIPDVSLSSSTTQHTAPEKRVPRLPRTARCGSFSLPGGATSHPHITSLYKLCLLLLWSALS